MQTIKKLLKIKPQPTEAQIQASFFEWLQLAKPAIYPYAFHVPNGGLRDIRVARKLKKQGVKPGVADVFVMISNKHWHGLWLEFKRYNGVQSEYQKEFAKLALNSKYDYRVVNCTADAIHVLEKYLEAK